MYRTSIEQYIYTYPNGQSSRCRHPVTLCEQGSKEEILQYTEMLSDISIFCSHCLLAS